MAARRLAALLLRCERATAAQSGLRDAAARLPPASGAVATPPLSHWAAACQCRQLSLGATAHAALDAQPRYGGQTLEEIRSRIFGTHIGNGLPSGRKLLRKKLVGDKIASYYEVPIEKTDPLFESLDDERCAALGLHREFETDGSSLVLISSCGIVLDCSTRTTQEEDEAGQAQTAREGTAKEGGWQAVIKALTFGARCSVVRL